MAAKKKASKFGEKAAFVRGLPRTMTAAQVIEEGKKKGISLSANYIYLLRSKSGSSAPKGKPGRKAGASRTAVSGSAEARLRSAIAEIGLTQARAILAQVEAAFSGR